MVKDYKTRHEKTTEDIMARILMNRTTQHGLFANDHIHFLKAKIFALGEWYSYIAVEDSQ